MRLLLIGGGSGSGKTWLARAVMARLGESARLISQDDFYHDLADQPSAHTPGGLDATRVDFDQPDALDFALMARTLGALKSGQPAEVPHYDFATHRRRPGRTFEPAETLVVEGILVLGQERLLALADLSVFVDADEAVRQRRRLARDMDERGRTRADALRQMRDQVFPAHDRHVQPSLAHADLVVTAARLEADMDGAVADICARLTSAHDSLARPLDSPGTKLPRGRETPSPSGRGGHEG